MSFLKSLGKIFATITPLVLGTGSLIGPLLGSKGNQNVVTGINDFTSIASLVVQIEAALQGQPGAAKFAAAVNLVGPVIKTSQVVSGKKIADPAALQKGIEEVTQGMVDILNSIDGGDSSIKTEIQHN